jgi:hypothetical protein
MEEHMEQTATAKGGGWVYDEEGEMGATYGRPGRSVQAKSLRPLQVTDGVHFTVRPGQKNTVSNCAKNVRGWTVYSAILASGPIPSPNATTL